MSSRGDESAAGAAAALRLRRRPALALRVARALALASVFACAAVPVRAAEPDVEGFSSERLQRLDRFLEASTREDGYLGAVALIARHGRTIELRAFGHRDLARAEPMRTDAIFRIYSMTKTVATVAVMILVEEGRLTLDDPVERWLPEFANARVFAGGTADAPELRAPKTKPTLHHLLTHTAGFATSGRDPAEARALMDRADLRSSKTLHDFASRLARVPLAADPGTRFAYDGVQIEAAARIVEVASGEPFDAFLKRRILDPLRMADTDFSVPAEKRGRVADLTTMGGDGKLRLADTPNARHPGERSAAYPSGAGGLYSTASDYARFAQMLLDGGELDGARILGRKTVELMMQNHLTMLAKPVTEFSDAEGFGLGGSVLLDPALRGRLGSVGQFGWSGAASTYYTIDPKEGVVAMLLLQHLPNDENPRDLPRISTKFYDLVYQALIR